MLDLRQDVVHEQTKNIHKQASRQVLKLSPILVLLEVIFDAVVLHRILSGIPSVSWDLDLISSLQKYLTKNAKHFVALY